MARQKLEAFDRKQTNWFGVWYDKNAHGYSSCVLKLSELRKFKGNVRIYLRKNKYFNNGENGRPNYTACIKDANSDNPFDLEVLDISECDESQERLYTMDEVRRIIEGVCEDARRGYDAGDLLIEDYIF